MKKEEMKRERGQCSGGEEREKDKREKQIETSYKGRRINSENGIKKRRKKSCKKK